MNEVLWKKVLLLLTFSVRKYFKKFLGFADFEGMSEMPSNIKIGKKTTINYQQKRC